MALTYETGSLAGDLAKAQSLTTQQNSIKPQPTNPSQGQPVVIQPAQTTGAAPLTLPQPTNDVTQANATVAGANQTTKSLQDYMNMLEPPKTALDQQNQALADRLSQLYGSDTGKAQETAKLEDTTGVNALKKQLADINAQILTQSAQYDKAFADAEKQPGMLSSIVSGQQGAIRRSQAADIGLLQARALGMQGQVQAAQDAVTRAINLKYQGIEEEITAKEKQMALIAPMLTQQQQKVANAQQLMLQDQRDKIAEQKSIQTANANYAITNKIQEPYFYRGNVLVKTSDGTPMFENQGGTIVRLSDGKKYPDSASFFADAGINNWNQIHTKTNPAVKFETVTIGSGKGNVKVRYGYDETGQIVSATNLNTGQPMNFHGNGTLTSNVPVARNTTTPSPKKSKKVTLAEGTNAADSYVQSVKGKKDGFISPEDWKTVKQAWIADGLDVNSFYSRFKKYINPADPQDY